MSEAKHRGVRRGKSPFEPTHYNSAFVSRSPGVTFPNEDPEKWQELSGDVEEYTLGPEKLEEYKNRKPRRGRHVKRV